MLIEAISFYKQSMIWGHYPRENQMRGSWTANQMPPLHVVSAMLVKCCLNSE